MWGLVERTKPIPVQPNVPEEADTGSPFVNRCYRQNTCQAAPRSKGFWWGGRRTRREKNNIPLMGTSKPPSSETAFGKLTVMNSASLQRH